MDYVSRGGLAGGLLTSLILAIQTQDLVRGIVMAGVGALTSFLTIQVLNYLGGKIRQW